MRTSRRQALAALGRALAAAAAAPVCARAGDPPTAREFLGHVTGLLSGDKGEAFMALFDPRMPELARFRSRVLEMMAQCEVSTGIDVVEETAGENGIVRFDVDWELELITRGDPPARENRRRRVRLELERSARSWKVKSLAPIELFGPVATARTRK